ncbi:MAG: hypothetical protein AB1483_00485 [Candidatus Zixiibacteriota bacterium]
MTQWSEKLIQETKVLFKDKSGKELSAEDAIECLDNMANFAEVLLDIYYKEKAKGNDILADKTETRG